MQDLKDTLKRLFETTGKPGYYMMLKALNKEESKKR